jgi:YD repeat-containing protein
LLSIRALPLFSQAGGAGIAPPKMAPPSPDVAALFKFSELPVTLYTGLPSVSIPFFEIKLKELSIPVGLQYHTGGIKVDEVASSVGMNWSLNAGGSVNAMVRGKNDLGNGYITYPITPEIYSGAGQFLSGVPDGGASYNWCIDVINGLNDPELDMFNFIAPDINGKFFLDADGDAHVAPIQPIKVLPFGGNGAVRIINEKGVLYTFGWREETGSSFAGSSYNYYLTQIVTPSKDTVNFIYEPRSYSYLDYVGETRVQYISGDRHPELLLQAGEVVTSGAFFDSTHVIGGARIKSITCTNGTRVDFNYATIPRKDLPGANALTDVSLYYKTRFIRKFVLQQEYKGDIGAPDLCRLWLSQVYEEGAGGIRATPYKFTYNPKALPKRLSNAQDHWGQATGLTTGGNTRLPKNKDYWPDDAMGTDRSPDTVYSQAGLMTSLTYPTGGSTAFTYEPNDVWIDNERSITKTDVVEGITGAPFTVREISFVIPSGVKTGRIFYNTYKNGPPSGGGGGIPDPTDDEESSGITVLKPNGQTQEFSLTNSNPNGDLVNWGPGNYKVTLNTFGDSYSGFFELRYERVDTSYFTGKRIVGGWRIKRLAYKDPYTASGDKTYRYTYSLNDSFPEHSSGVLPATKPQYEYFRNLSMRKLDGPKDVSILSCQVVVQSANSLLPLWNDHGHIFYERVTVLDGENGENGKSEHTFGYMANTGGYYGYPYVPATNNDQHNGKLLTKIDSRRNKDGTFTIIQFEQNKYKTGKDSLFWQDMYHKPEPPEFLKGIGASVNMELPIMSIGMQVYPYVFTLNTYHYSSTWLQLDSTIVTQYPGGSQALKTVISYAYRNGVSLQPTEIKTVNSKNEETLMTKTYPSDYKGIAVYDTMVKRNMVVPTIQQTNSNNNKILIRQRTNFLRTPANLYLPGSVDKAIYGNVADTEIVYSRYDEKGNLLEYYTRDGVTHSFLWGYNQSYLVTEITGCGYDKALSYISPGVLTEPTDAQLRTELNKIRLGIAATSATVVSYTHAPLIGVTSVTDPNGRTSYYEYDGLNRLKVIKDKDGKILKQYDYQYQVPVTQ